jgi:hypothetical protein
VQGAECTVGQACTSAGGVTPSAGIALRGVDPLIFLEARSGISCGLHRIERLMRLQALKARPRRRRLPPDLGPAAPLQREPNCLSHPVGFPWFGRKYGNSRRWHADRARGVSRCATDAADRRTAQGERLVRNVRTWPAMPREKMLWGGGENLAFIGADLNRWSTPCKS